MKRTLLIISVTFLIVGGLVHFKSPVVHAGIYGCIWNPYNAPGEQCMLNGSENACTNAEVPGICDLSNETDCNNFFGSCTQVSTYSLWGCGADGKCTLQNGGIFPTENSCKQNCRPKVMYNCVDPKAPQKCLQVFTQSGQYTSANECNTKCIPPPASGNGTLLCSDEASIFTAFGCVPFQSIRKIVGFFVSWGIGIGGGWALLLTIYAGIQIITSSGDPAKLQAGREILFSAFTGILMLIFSVFLLRVIGLNTLGLF